MGRHKKPLDNSWRCYECGFLMDDSEGLKDCRCDYCREWDKDES